MFEFRKLDSPSICDIAQRSCHLNCPAAANSRPPVLSGPTEEFKSVVVSGFQQSAESPIFPTRDLHNGGMSSILGYLSPAFGPPFLLALGTQQK